MEKNAFRVAGGESERPRTGSSALGYGSARFQPCFESSARTGRLASAGLGEPQTSREQDELECCSLADKENQMRNFNPFPLTNHIPVHSRLAPLAVHP